MKFSFRIMGTRQSHLVFILGWTLFLITECKGSLTINKTNPYVTTIEEQGISNYKVSMDENNHVWDETKPTPLFKVIPDSGNCSTITTSFLTNSYQFKYILENCIFKANQSFDYETPSERVYTFTLTDTRNGESVGIGFTINNIDDEPPQLGSLKCEMDEYTIYSVANSSCKVTILDPDGWLAKMTLTVNKGEADEDTIFNLDYKDTPADTVYEDDLFLFNNVTLDYAKRTAYLFSITVTDSGNNSASQTAIVNVKDLRNVKPIWTKSLQFEEIDEKSVKEYEVTAIDGDTGIHEIINYFKEKEDDESANYVSIDKITGKTTVTKINRDKDDITTYSFTLKACIESNPDWCTSQDVTLLVKDINDNAPLIMANNYTNGSSPQEFEPTEKKEINIEFLENFDGKFNFSTLIKDIDTGENAQFSVELFDTSNTYSKAFLIVPTAGYKEGNFQISVKNKTYLDYEDEVWRNFTFSVISTDTADNSLNDEMLINVSLIDYNDELPIFNQTEYNATINETAKSGTWVLQAHATDRDEIDKVLKMDILGSYAEKRFSINSDGDITVQVSDEYYLDFDVLSSVFFQVTATDNASHVTTVPVTITIKDVNNKPPTIEPKDSVNFDENQKNGVLFFEDIKASDPDTDANLTAWIDWDASYVTKNSRRLEKNETILNAMQFLDLTATTGRDGRDISINVFVVNSNDDNPDKPDFEIFDSLYLNIVVQDLNTDPEFMQNNQTSAFFLVTLNDVNDNPPYFTDSNTTNRTVQEVSSIGTAVGSITAVDPDISDTVSYYCECNLGEDYDWIKVDVTTGEFQVKNDKINADNPDYLYYINYTCNATDGVHNTSKPVDFYIIDTNNKYPNISKYDNIEFHVIEKAPKDTPVDIITPVDFDRDIPFHTVKCLFQYKDHNTCYEEFVFSDSYPDNNNQIVMKNGNVSRDVPGTSPFTCYVQCTDNVNSERQQESRPTGVITIKIILDDKNDNAPILQTSELSCSESLVNGKKLDKTIIGMDIDEGINAEIDFYIESIIKNNDNTNDYISYFNIFNDNDYVLNDTFKQVHLTVEKDLKGLYGSYTINLLLKDRGDEPLNSTGTIDLTIDKYNFAPPTINFPNDDNKIFYLLDSQEIGKPLANLNNSEELQDFDATDGATTDCSKWDVTFTFQLIQETGYSLDDIFYLDQKPNQPCTAQLQVNKQFKTTEVTMKKYKMELTAWLNSTENEEIPGDQQYFTSTTITIIFVNQTIEPTFETQTWDLSFEENNTYLTADLGDNAAQYEIHDDQYSIFYYLVSDNDIPRSFFEVNEKYGNISVIEEFFYDDYQQFKFQIVASNDKTNVSTDPRSYLSVTINVLSTNRRTPKFVSNSFFGAIIPNGATSGNKVTEIQAYDEDYCDQGRLKFTITSEINCTGNGWENAKPDFYLTTSNDIASVYLDFSVESTMTGYCSFEVTVTDTVDQFNHGPHQNTTTTTIFIITTENIVEFRFMNNASTVVEKKKTMLDIITDQLGYDSYDKLIEESKGDAQQYTKASLYFIEKNDDQVNPVTSITILQTVGSTDGFTKLANALRVEELYLMSFPNTDSNGSNSEAVLKKWLIAVSAILACLCLALLITLIIKIRQLHKTISNLTTKQFGSQDSGLNRLGILAPTTNKHAIEGSNPVYKNEEIKHPKNMNDFDTQSIRSGDSDLVGVENNSEFDYNFNDDPNKTTYL